MGLLQAAYRTYESQAHKAGLVEEGKEPLTPLSHMIQNAQIEIAISDDGRFLSAAAVAKADAKTIIPATVDSANRVSKNTNAHPLSDRLRYLAPYGEDKHAAFLTQLEAWANSPHTHPKVRAVQKYMQGQTLLDDLAAAGVITLDEAGRPGDGRIEGIAYDKCLVRWRVLPAPEGIKSACWEDPTLFQSFAQHYADACAGQERDLCLVCGQEDRLCNLHPKGVVGFNFGAKLLSANDTSGFTYRGRFTQARQAGNVGYTTSQKAHSALRWLAANQGVLLGGRTFLCWNPKGIPLPTQTLFFSLPSEEKMDFPEYKNQLLSSLGGYQLQLQPNDEVVIAGLDAATTGRLSVTYYSELRASDFLNRLQSWYESCCWNSLRFGVQSPPLRRIVECAFGTQRDNFIEADARVLREHVQRLLHCIIDQQPLPLDIVQALAVKASSPLAYTPGNRELLLATTCAIVRKYRNDKAHKEVWTLSLEKSNTDRSYLFGRLLAVAEQVERSTYGMEEGRETNAIRLQTVFSQRPLYAWRLILESLNPYFAKLNPGLRKYYKDLIGEITNLLPPTDNPELNKKLDDVYLLGYYHQRSAMLQKKQPKTEEETENEPAES